MKLALFLQLSFITLLAFWCMQDARADEKKPDIHGVPSKVAVGADGAKGKRPGSFFVEGVKGFNYDKALIRLTEKSVIQIQDGKLVKEGTLEDLKKATKVSVWFTGPVAESYPVQAIAGKILILERESDKK